MDYPTHKYKLTVSFCLLNSEKDRIKDIIKAYNNRLEKIYNSLISLMDQLDEINKIEHITDKKDQINNLILYSKIFNNTNDEIKILKSDVNNNLNKIEDKNKILETNIINKNSNEFIKIKNICNNTFNELK